MLVQNSLSEVLRAREELFSKTNWTDPTSQLQNRVKGEELARYFLLTESEILGIQNTIRLLVSTTPYYLSLSDPSDPNCPIRRMIVPTSDESIFSEEESPDPLEEERLSPVRGLTHMYPNRVLLFQTIPVVYTVVIVCEGERYHPVMKGWRRQIWKMPLITFANIRK